MSNKGDDTRTRILDAGVALAVNGLHCVGYRQVARAIGATHTGVRYYFATPAELQNAVAARAVEMGNGAVIAHLIVIRHRSVEEMDPQDRNSYILDL